MATSPEREILYKGSTPEYSADEQYYPIDYTESQPWGTDTPLVPVGGVAKDGTVSWYTAMGKRNGNISDLIYYVWGDERPPDKQIETVDVGYTTKYQWTGKGMGREILVLPNYVAVNHITGRYGEVGVFDTPYDEDVMIERAKDYVSTLNVSGILGSSGAGGGRVIDLGYAAVAAIAAVPNNRNLVNILVHFSRDMPSAFDVGYGYFAYVTYSDVDYSKIVSANVSDPNWPSSPTVPTRLSAGTTNTEDISTITWG